MTSRLRALTALCAGLIPACGDGAPWGHEGRSDTGTRAPTDAGLQDAGAPEGQCAEAAERLGHPVCLHRIDSDADWRSVAAPLDRVDQVRSTKYFVPASDAARLRPLFIDADYYTMHYNFMVEAFEPLFEALTTGMYLDLLFDPALREYYVGEVIESRRPGGDTFVGFYVAGDAATPKLVGCEDLETVYGELSDRMPGFELAVIPFDAAQRELVGDCGLPVFNPDASLEYELYHYGAGYGTVRLHTLRSLSEALETGAIGWQDILVVDEAPFDVETVVSGVVTGTRQSPLSHLAVRGASRGTPNCYLRDAAELLASWDGELVKATCDTDTLTVSAATVEEAEAFWAGIRPSPVTLPDPDPSFTELLNLLDLPVADPTERSRSRSRFGGKARNLAWLYQTIDDALQFPGFGIPVAYYQAFIEDNTWAVDVGAGLETLSFAETLSAYLEDETFRTDGQLRQARLAALRGAMTDSPCDPDLLDRLASEILRVFGADNVMVRFRSSSNAEDDLRFNGAGLYESASACLADQLDGDVIGPSRCDPQQDDERDLCRALKQVWASLWNRRAYDEREWYGIDHARAAMGILVNPRTTLEVANAVAFSGNPLGINDPRYLVSAQAGEIDVVSSRPGVWPEQVLLTVSDGAVSDIDYVLSSSELPEGEHVLEVAHLNRMGELLFELSGIYPIDDPLPDGADVYLDTEWKVTQEEALVVKQIRPFLKTAP